MKKRIAIVGATSHIAKGLIYNFCRDAEADVSLFARSIGPAEDFLNAINGKNRYPVYAVGEFGREEYDVVINCIGMGRPALFKDNEASIFRLTETYDDLVLGYLKNNNGALFINFSSGAVYGGRFDAPVDGTDKIALDPDSMHPADFYGIAKINSEAKHRAFPDYNIVDLRMFGYFSRFIDLESQYFLTEIIQCINREKEFVTDPTDMSRDYVHHEDLFSLVRSCMQHGRINTVFDVYSSDPVTKREILDYFIKEYGLTCTVRHDKKPASVTGIKKCYYSKDRKARTIGYRPRFSSLENIIEESRFLLSKSAAIL